MLPQNNHDYKEIDVEDDELPKAKERPRSCTLPNSDPYYSSHAWHHPSPRQQHREPALSTTSLHWSTMGKSRQGLLVLFLFSLCLYLYVLVSTRRLSLSPLPTVRRSINRPPKLSTCPQSQVASSSSESTSVAWIGRVGNYARACISA